MKITEKQVNAWNAKCSNGFKLDIQRCVIWNDKVAFKVIDLEDGRKIKAEIGWYEERKTTWGKVEGVRPKLHLSIWMPSETTDMWFSNGVGATVTLTEKLYKRRSWDEIAKITAEWDTDAIMEEAKKHMAKLLNARVV